MSQSAVAALESLPFELVYSDGEPLDSNWERIQINLLIDLIRQAMTERGRTDFFAGGNMFVYYSYEQAREIAELVASGRLDRRRHFRGPDVFFVSGVQDGDRNCWVVWEEGDHYPNLVVELLSRSTAKLDRTVKKDLYAHTFHTPEYFLFDPRTTKLDGLRLSGDVYRPVPNAQGGQFWSEQLGLYLGLWRGVRTGVDATWVRLYRPDGTLVPTAEELAEAANRRAEEESQRAQAAEARAEAERQRALAAEARAAAAEAELERLRSRG